MVELHEHADLARLHTNAAGNVLFANNNFLELMQYPTMSQIILSPLSEVMGLAPEVATRFLSVIKSGGEIQELITVTRSSDNALLERDCIGQAKYDQMNMYIGANFLLYSQEEVSQFRHSLSEIDLTKMYFIEQIEAMQVLIARMMGVKLQQALVIAINDMAIDNGWDIKLVEGQIDIRPGFEDVDAFQYVLKNVQSHVSDILGKKIVMYEISQLEDSMSQEMVSVADATGLRHLM